MEASSSSLHPPRESRGWHCHASHEHGSSECVACVSSTECLHQVRSGDQQPPAFCVALQNLHWAEGGECPGPIWCLDHPPFLASLRGALGGWYERSQLSSEHWQNNLTLFGGISFLLLCFCDFFSSFPSSLLPSLFIALWPLFFLWPHFSDSYESYESSSPNIFPFCLSIPFLISIFFFPHTLLLFELFSSSNPYAFFSLFLILLFLISSHASFGNFSLLCPFFFLPWHPSLPQFCFLLILPQLSPFFFFQFLHPPPTAAESCLWDHVSITMFSSISVRGLAGKHWHTSVG